MNLHRSESEPREFSKRTKSEQREIAKKRQSYAAKVQRHSSAPAELQEWGWLSKSGQILKLDKTR